MYLTQHVAYFQYATGVYMLAVNYKYLLMNIYIA